MDQHQYLQYIQSTPFVNKYLAALQGKREETVNNILANDVNTIYPLSNAGISQFTRERAFDQLFTTQVNRLGQTTENRGNNIDLTTATEYENPVKALLFSQKNIDFLQQRCIEWVYYKTNKKYLISPQDQNQVVQIITHVYNNITVPNYYAEINSPEFKQTIAYLNSFILKEMNEYVYNSLLNYISYSEFLANGILPIDRPVNMSIKGTNTLITK